MGVLATERCQDCTPGTPPLSAADVADLSAGIDSEWTASDTTLERHFVFKNFSQAFAFATRIALVAEQQGHHPDLRLGWGYADVTLSTHSIGGLSRNDFIMAAKIDALLRNV